jgi:hypothetical protein
LLAVSVSEKLHVHVGGSQGDDGEKSSDELHVGGCLITAPSKMGLAVNVIELKRNTTVLTLSQMCVSKVCMCVDLIAVCSVYYAVVDSWPRCTVQMFGKSPAPPLGTWLSRASLPSRRSDWPQ